jgi:hypothetical protein
MVRGSKAASPPRPPVHAWKVVCRAGGLTVEEQIERVVGRLRPVVDRIAALVQQPDASADGVTATLQVVRYLDDEDGEEEGAEPTATGLVRLSGQHQFLGWHLDLRVLQFLCVTGAELDVDEYG